MKTNQTQQNYYGLFYKSHGEWIGPWFKEVLTKKEITAELPRARKILKSKVSTRKVKFI
jgi:hypothetical protein